MPEYCFLLAGLVGAIIGNSLREGGIELPSIVSMKNGTGKKLCLGGLVGLAAGALAGMYANHTLWNAACYGFTGTALIQNGGARVFNMISGNSREIRKDSFLVEDADGIIEVAAGCQSKKR